jgi:hypothetical protein
MQAVWSPFTETKAPVMKLASSASRKTVTAAISEGSPATDRMSRLDTLCGDRILWHILREGRPGDARRDFADEECGV